ncbi:MAG: FAD-dependent oxidoreductase [Aerococcus sp.]|nr:FAD-dependent oxidoreductase [Aerococcus sp.]
MNQLDKRLFETVELPNGVTLKNRLVMTPMTTESGYYDGKFPEELINYYRTRAGQASMIIVESAFVSDEGRGFPGAIGVDKDDKIPGLTRLAKAIKGEGSKALLQLYHAGRMAWPYINGGKTPIAPSPVPALRPNAPVPREMSTDEIEDMIKKFGDAAKRAIEAGFDGVDIHGANTFLLQQFFSPHSNRRSDEWGGTREKRVAFPMAVLREVKRVAHEMGKDDFIIGYRFSPEELEEPGIRFEDTMYLLNTLAEEKPDYVFFSMGSYDRPSIVNREDPEPTIRKYHALASKALKEIPVMGVGRILQSKDATAALDMGYTLLAAGKAFLLAPDWVSHLEHDEELPDFVDTHKQEELKIPTPLWDFIDYMRVDPDEEMAQKQRLQKIQEEGAHYKPGSYQVIAKGHTSDLPMTVTFTEDHIESIDVDQSGESEGLSDQVFERMPKQIIEGQTLNVDAVSGASASSQGLIDGVSEAVLQASDADTVEFLKRQPKPVVQWSKEVVDEQFDIAVIGGGAAGISAALRADEVGLKTVLIEKLSFLGGCISISGGNQVVMGSKLQKAAGVTDDSVASMVSDFKKNGNNENDETLLTLFAEHVGETTDWLHEHVGVNYDEQLHVLAEYEHNRELAYEGGGHGFAAVARKAMENSNVTVYYQTAVDHLTTEDGKVTGLVAKEATDETHNIETRGVILATGGFGNNKELLPEALRPVLYYGPTSSNGEGVIVAKDGVNAKTQNMQYGKIYPNGIEVANGIAKSTIDGNLRVLKDNALLVNSDGKRVINERASNHEILDVLMSQEKRMLYLLMDQKAFDEFRAGVLEGGIADTDIDRWLANNGSQTPLFYHADSLVELAERAGMPQESLQETVDRYNQFVSDKEDPDFHRQAKYLQRPVEQGHYYLVEQKPRFATTMGGLVVNPDLQVQNDNDQAVNGLYAAGEIVGGVMGTDSPSGANNAWALTSGKLAAEHIAATK